MFQMEAVKSSLQASLLVRHPETKELFVNFDFQIFTMIKEANHMFHLGLDIPPVAKSMRARECEYKNIYSALTVSYVSCYILFPQHCSHVSYSSINGYWVFGWCCALWVVNTVSHLLHMRVKSSTTGSLVADYIAWIFTMVCAINYIEDDNHLTRAGLDHEVLQRTYSQVPNI